MNMQKDQIQIASAWRVFGESFDITLFYLLIANWFVVMVLLFGMSYQQVHNFGKYILLIDGGVFQLYLLLARGSIHSLKSYLFYFLCNEPLLLIAAEIAWIYYLHRVRS